MSTENKFRELIGISIGEASMCWSETPSGVFDSTRAKEISDKLIAAVEQLKADIQELKTIIKEMSDHSKGYGHCGMDMFAHTKWRKFADDV